MKLYFLLCSILLLIFSVTADIKKGIGCSDGCDVNILADANAGWYYGWGALPDVPASNVPFVPMCYSGKRVDSISSTNNFLLGFNEPDNTQQSNMNVSYALSLWPSLVSKSNLIVSPATAGNPAAVGSWLQQFMNGNPKVDYIGVHWYGGADASKFKSRMTQIYTKFGKPLWITQFACQTGASSTADPNKYTQAQVDAFLDSVIPWMQATSWIDRYCWHSSKVGTSSLWDINGVKTATYTKYASF